MSETAIKVENLGKSYQIGHNTIQGERYTALRDVIAYNVRNLASKTRDMFQGKAIVQGDEVEEFWALKDINFEIKQGERVGIIGRNGAGKSTLLKILSRITEPTTGRITINGRVASLLEVGTGFHPELTGRENIFLNAAILGMSRREIQRKFDEIVDFAEVAKFLDTPVKRYSSGMYVRLAFAVAAHIETEILVVDEVLAVGDAEFQLKCIGKMNDVAADGRTLIFVSHSASAISRLTSKAIYLVNGNMHSYGETQLVLNEYSLGNKSICSHVNFSSKDKYKEKEKEIAELNYLSIQGARSGSTSMIGIDESIEIEVKYTVYENFPKVTSIIQIYSADGTCIFSTNDWNDKDNWVNYNRIGKVTATLNIPSHFLSAGYHHVTVALGSYNPNQLHAHERNALTFEIIEPTVDMGARGEYITGDWPGIIRPLLKWNVNVL